MLYSWDTTSQAMASKCRPREGPSIDLVSLEDESGWLVNMRDVIKHSHLLYPIVKRYLSFVPRIMLTMPISGSR